MNTSIETGGVLLEPHPKKGIAKRVEDTVQEIVNDEFATIDTVLAKSDTELDQYFTPSITGDYKRSQRQVQIRFATLGAAACQRLLPRLTTVHRRQGSFGAPPDMLNSYFNIPKNAAGEDPAYTESLKTAYWTVACINKVIATLKRPDHPLHPVYTHLTAGFTDHTQAHKVWHHGPGKDRWPYELAHNDPEVRLLSTFTINLHFATSILAASAIHHLIHQNRKADSEELAHAIDTALPHVAWETSCDRHVAWTPEWREIQAEKGFAGYHINPVQGVPALLQSPVEKIIEPGPYDASVNELWCMRQPTFHSHPVLQQGPITAAGNCGGDVFWSYPNARDTQAAQDFFSEMGLDPNCGNRFSLSSVAFAIGRSVMHTIVLPAYEANRLKSAS